MIGFLLIFIVFHASLAHCAPSSHSRPPSHKTSSEPPPFVVQTLPHAPLEGIYDRKVAKKALETSRERRNLKRQGSRQRNTSTHADNTVNVSTNDHFAAADAEAKQAKAYSDAYVKHYTENRDVLPTPSYAKFKAQMALTTHRKLQSRSDAQRSGNEHNAMATNNHHTNEDKKFDDRVIESNLYVIRCNAIHTAALKKKQASSRAP